MQIRDTFSVRAEAIHKSSLPHSLRPVSIRVRRKPMIELTQEQWQAIAREENPTLVEPGSKTAYVVVRKDLHDKLAAMVDHDTATASLLDAVAANAGIGLSEAEKALALRVIWMRRMGLDEGEITDSLRMDPPDHIEREMTELLALEKLKTMPSSESLCEVAIKY
jgi:hypothetical protein